MIFMTVLFCVVLKGVQDTSILSMAYEILKCCKTTEDILFLVDFDGDDKFSICRQGMLPREWKGAGILTWLFGSTYIPRDIWWCLSMFLCLWLCNRVYISYHKYEMSEHEPVLHLRRDCISRVIFSLYLKKKNPHTHISQYYSYTERNMLI